MVLGGLQLFKEMNKRIVLSLIQSKGPISRGQIANQSHLTAQSVTNIVNELLRENWVEEFSIEQNHNVGRKPILLRIKNESIYSMGFWLQRGQVQGVLANGKLEILQKQIVPLTALNVGNYQAAVLEIMDHLLADAHFQLENLIGIGMASPGLVNKTTNTLLIAPKMNIRQWNVEKWLKDKGISSPVFLEHDVRSIAMAEKWTQNQADAIPSICVYLGDGLGASFIFNEGIYSGATFAGGELGHVVVDANGPLCHCGNYGCLTTYASIRSIIERLRTTKSYDSGKTWLNSDDLADWSIVCEAYQANDPLCVRVINEGIQKIGMVLANIMNLLDPHQFILSGPLLRIGSNVESQIEQILKERNINQAAHVIPRVVRSRFLEDGPLLGAAALPIYHQFRMPTF